MSPRILGVCILSALVILPMPLSALDGGAQGKPKLENVEIGAKFGGRIGLDIVGVDADKGIITYVPALGKNKGAEKKVQAVRDCVCKVGYFRFGKPASAMEGEVIANGLRNPIFQKASVEKPVRVDLLTAQRDDDTLGIKKGDVVKVLVNPKE